MKNKFISLGLGLVVIALVFATHTAQAATILSSITASSTVDGTGATIMWNSDEAATSQVAYGTSSMYTATTTLDSNMLTSHSVVLTGLSPYTMYHYQIISTDALGSTTSSDDQTFSTNYYPLATSTATTTFPTTFSLSASATGSTTGAFYAGSPVNIVATAATASTTGSSTPGIVDVEVFDPSNMIAYQQVFTQDFGINNSVNYSIGFTPTTTGIYTVKLGAFNTDWTQNYAWNNNALDVTIIAPTNTNTSTTTTTTTSPVNTSWPDITLSPSTQTVTAGQHLDFNGRNFPHEEDINVSQNGTWVGKAHADGGGNFTTGSMTMPSIAGTYTYTFVGATTGATMSSTITVQ